MKFENFAPEANQSEAGKDENKAELEGLNTVDDGEKSLQPLGVESFEDRERWDEAQEFLDLTILNNYSKIDEGHNGVMASIDLNEVRNNFFKGLVDKGLEGYEQIFYDCFDLKPEQEMTDEVAVKMLKIYSYEKGEHEVDMQKRAYDLINQAESPEELFAIPKIYFNLAVDTKQNKFLETKLQKDGIGVADHNVYMMGMERVKGNDLMTHLYKEILKNEGDYVSESIDKMSFSELERIAGFYVGGFEVAGAKSRNEGERNFEQAQVSRENESRVIDYLKKNGLQLPKAMFDKLDNGFKLLHKQNIYHRDAHARNIMFDYDEGGEIKGVWLVDFGTAKEISPLDDPYKEGELSYVKDDHYLKFKPLSKSKAESSREADEQFMKDFSDLLHRVETKREISPSDKERYQGLRDELEYLIGSDQREGEVLVSNLYRELGLYADSQSLDSLTAKKIQVAMLEKLGQERPDLIGREKLIACLQAETKNPKLPKPIYNLLSEYLRIKSNEQIEKD